MTVKKSPQLLEAIERAETIMGIALVESATAFEARRQVVLCEAMKSVREIYRSALLEWENT